MKTLVTIIIIILAVLIPIKVTAYTVREGQQVVITQFGRPVRVVEKAGLRFKLPYPIQTVHRLEKRLLPWDGEPENMQTRDKKRIFIDVWARWRIIDPMKFFRAVRTQRRGYKILDDLVDSAVRDVVANHNLIEVVRSTNDDLEYETEELAEDMRTRQEKISVGRAKMEELIRDKADKNLKDQYGMKLAVVRVKRVNYVRNVREEVYLRMQSERMRIAELFLSEAVQEQNKILGLMAKQLEEIIGETEQRSAEIRGAADAEVIRIAAEGYSKSPEFYEFLRSLEAYGKTLASGTRLILSSDNKFLRQLNEPTVKPKR